MIIIEDFIGDISLMRLDAFKQGLQSITDSAKEALEIFKPVKDALQGEVIDTQLTKLENKVDHKENLKENQEYITALTEYLKEVLTPSEIDAIGDIFAGDTLADQLSAFVSEQFYNLEQLTKGNSAPRDALQQAFDLKDGTTNIQTALDEFYNQYSQSLGTAQTISFTQAQSLTDHYKKLLSDKENVQTKKSEYATHNADYRAKTNPTPTIERYLQYNKDIKQKKIKDPNIKIVEQLPSQSLEKFIGIAKSQLGINEYDASADKYLHDIGHRRLNAKTTPRCGAFVSWCLKQSGFPAPKNNLSAKSFINGSGLGHVGIKIGDNILGGNQSNKVTLTRVKNKIVGYALPHKDGIQSYQGSYALSDIPEGAIVVFDRKRTQYA